MEVVGIICEYNPLHRGHWKQLQRIRTEKGADCGIVCLMSGNFVQRGHPAIADKLLRSQAAIRCGADLVLELPVTCALSSAEGFAAGGVRLLGGFCDALCFGAETADAGALIATAQALLSPEFSAALRRHLDRGLSFPAARQAALGDLGLPGELLNQPNNILAVEYCKAILAQETPMQPWPISRPGDYHAAAPDPEDPSATALRALMLQGAAWQDFVPKSARELFSDAPLHALAWGEKAMLARLRTMADAEFEALPFGSEGLWRKLMHAARQENTLEDILTAVKSKRYTRTRLDRMVMCAFLRLTADDLATPAPYARVLALNDRGRQILKKARQTGCFPNLGESQDHPYQVIETRCDRLYGLFAAAPEAPERKAAPIYLPQT